MADKLSLENLASLQNENSAISSINKNFKDVSEFYNDLLSTTLGGAMNVPLDMNGQKIINLPNPTSNLDPVRLIDLITLVPAGPKGDPGDPLRFSNYAAATAATNKQLINADRLELSGYYSPGDCITPLVYIPLSTGPSVIREWHLQTANGQWWVLNVPQVSPRSFGSNGTPEKDTPALQACQDYPAASIIITGSETYFLGAAGLKLSSNKYWTGAKTTIKMSVAPTGDMLLAINKTSFFIRGVIFDGNGMLTGTSSSYAAFLLPCAYIGACSDFDLSDCKAVGWKTCGILLNVVSNCFVRRNFAKKADPTGVYVNYGICVVGGVGSESNNVRIEENTCEGCNIAINTIYSWVTDNHVYGWGFSAGINVASSPSCYGNHIKRNKCHDCLRVPDRDNYFMDGIECWSPDSIVEGNQCWNCIGSGIGWGSRRGSCQVNTCYNNGLTIAEFTALGFPGATILGQGILSLADADVSFSAEDSLVANNILYDTRSGSARTQSFGYREITGYTFLNVTLRDNKAFGHITSSYSLNGTKAVEITAYTSTVTAAAGALGTGVVKNTFYQMLSPKLCYVQMDIVIPNNGTGSDSVIVTLPFTSAAGKQQVGSGVETAINGQMLAGVIPGASPTIKIKGQSNSYPGANGMRLALTFTYEIA